MHDFNGFIPELIVCPELAKSNLSTATLELGRRFTLSKLHRIINKVRIVRKNMCSQYAALWFCHIAKVNCLINTTWTGTLTILIWHPKGIVHFVNEVGSHNKENTVSRLDTTNTV